ncbi:uncharacterized protein ACIB01_011789 [Guaruba guarouba]
MLSREGNCIENTHVPVQKIHLLNQVNKALLPGRHHCPLPKVQHCIFCGTHLVPTDADKDLNSSTTEQRSQDPSCDSLIFSMNLNLTDVLIRRGAGNEIPAEMSD